MLATDHLLALRKEPQSDTNTNPRTLMASQFIQVQRLKSRFDFLRDKSAQGPAFISRYRKFSSQAENGATTEQLDEVFSALTGIDVSNPPRMLTWLSRGQRMQTIWRITSAPTATSLMPLVIKTLFNVFKTNQFKELQRQLFWGQGEIGGLAEALET